MLPRCIIRPDKVFTIDEQQWYIPRPWITHCNTKAFECVIYAAASNDTGHMTR